MSFKKLLRLAATVTVLLSLAAPAIASAAGSISLTANKSTVSSGGSLIVAIYVNAGGASVNAVQVDLNYPAGKLQYVGFSASGSAFEIAAANSGGDSTASIARGTTGAVTGSALVGTVTFKALAASGSAAIGVSGSSSLVSDGNAVAYGSSGTSVNFGAVAAAPAGSTKAAAPVAPEPPKDITPPVITALKTKNLTPFSVTITWTTSEPTDAAVDYGVDTNYGLGASSATPTVTHSLVLNSPFLSPQTLLHFRVKSVDGAGNPAVSTDQTVALPGVPVTVIVRGPNGQPQAGATVTLDGETSVSDSRGRVILHSSLGNKKIITNFQGVAIEKPITVSKTANPLPPYQLDLSKKPLNSWMLTSIGLFVVVLVLLGIDGLLFGSRLLARLAGLHFRPAGLVPALGHAARIGRQPQQATSSPVPNAASAPPAVPSPAPVVSAPTVVSRNDPEQAVTKLMGEPEPPSAPAEPIKINDVMSLGTPLKIELQPLTPMSPKPPLPGAPELVSTTNIAPSINKPTHRRKTAHRKSKTIQS